MSNKSRYIFSRNFQKGKNFPRCFFRRFFTAARKAGKVRKEGADYYMARAAGMQAGAWARRGAHTRRGAGAREKIRVVQKRKRGGREGRRGCGGGGEEKREKGKKKVRSLERTCSFFEILPRGEAGVTP